MANPSQSTEKLLRIPDPVEYARQVLGFDPWARQAEVVRSLSTHNRIAVRSGQKTGKSRAAAWAALWWYSTQPKAKVILTSSSDDQVRTILWPEVQALARDAASRGYRLGHVYDSHRSGVVAEDGRWILGFATDRADNMGGQSGPSMLFVVDESSGVPDTIWEAIRGNLAGGGKVLCFGNPLRPSGWFYDLFKDRRDSWNLLRLSSLEAADYQRDVRRVPGLANHLALQEEWAGLEGTAAYACRVLGEFPTQGADSIIAVSLIDEALARWSATPAAGRIEIGVDVARDGDDESVIAPVLGMKALPPRAVHGYDTHQVAGAALEVARELYRLHGGPKPRIKIDAIGYGAGVFDCVSRESDVEAVAVVVSKSPTSQPTAGPGYDRLRDQLWFAGREWLQRGGALPADRKLEAELAAPRFSFTAAGKLKVESKQELKRRIRRSPDRADALLLAVYQPPVRDFSYGYDPRIQISRRQ